MKKIKSIITAVLLCLSLTACGEEKEAFSQTQAYENMRNFYSDTASDIEDYYIQISKTQSEAHVMTEVCKDGDDCVFLEYDVMGALKFFRNNKLTNVTYETFYQPEEKDAQWSDFSYQKTADTYKNVLNALTDTEFSDSERDTYAIKEITVEETEDKSYPYKVTAQFDMNKINAKEMFSSGGNFGSVSVKFLSDEKGESFDDISLYVQYDYNDEIYVISAKYGEPNNPDEKGENGQRPDDIEKEYEKNLEELQASFEQYLEQMNTSYNQ
ncbi:MAG: hypothetical protein IJA12_01685 [Oscillospiraceae bacterium]|nr:hypothetical protein [Oscillospiraceae bacterium]